MAVCVIIDNPNPSHEIYDRVSAKMREQGPWPPEGAISHVAGACNGAWRVINVWESQEAFERFASERLQPILAELGAPPPSTPPVVFEVYNYELAR
jgi:hypothetical protein